ncbi:MAG TPA: phage holin family protein [Xanthobacteraceae bacterium]|nr:phage holin family protein [Xanthobacteraceae bacterium]
MMDNIVRHLRVLWRADSIIADIRFRVLLRRSGLIAFASLIAVFGLFMLNVAGYFALEQFWGPIWAAAVVSLIDFVVALVLVLIAARSNPGHELDLALEVRGLAMRGLEDEAQSVQASLVALHDEIRGVSTALTGFVRHPLDAALPALIGPLTNILLKALKKPERPPGP